MSVVLESLPPIVAEIAAPATTVFGLLSLDLPHPMVQPLPDEAHTGRLALIDADATSRWRSVEEVIAEPPDSVTYRLVRGPCSRLERHFLIRERGSSSRVLVETTWVPGGVFNRLSRQRQVAQATRSLLAAVRQQAERMARLRLVEPHQRTVHEESIDEDPALLQRRLLRAVEEQELTEWEAVGHGSGTAQYAAYLAVSLRLPEDMCRIVRLAGSLHDVGKTKVEPYLFNRVTTLSAAGQRRIEQHPQLGAPLVARLPSAALLVPAIRHHHERWDGEGYPDHLVGSQIPLVARIVAVAEAADAIQRPLPERNARLPHEVATILERHAGHQWDPDLAHRLADLLMQPQSQLLPSVSE